MSNTLKKTEGYRIKNHVFSVMKGYFTVMHYLRYYMTFCYFSHHLWILTSVKL